MGLNSFAGDVPRDEVKCIKINSQQMHVRTVDSFGGMKSSASLETFECKNFTQGSISNFYNIAVSFINNKQDLSSQFPVAIASLKGSDVEVVSSKAFKNVHTKNRSQLKIRLEDISTVEKVIIHALDEKSISEGKFILEIL